MSASDVTEPKAFGNLLDFLERLEQVKLWYHMIHVRDSIMVRVSVPGQMWEIEFFADGHVEIERFISTGLIEDGSILERLFSDYSE